MKHLITTILLSFLLLIVFPLNLVSQTCPTPQTLTVSNITTSSAQISCDVTADSYRILLTTNSRVSDPNTFYNWDVDTVVSSLPATIDILPNTKYYLYMQSLCDSASSDISLPQTFTSQCDIVYFLPWQERFEGGTSATSLDIPCWLNEYVSGSYVQHAMFSDDPVAGNNTMKMMFPAAPNTLIRVTLPSVDIPSADSLSFEFSIYRNDSANNDEGVSIIFSQPDYSYDTTFVPLNISVAGDVHTEASSGWYTYSILFSQAGATGIILLGHNDNTTPTYLDDLRVRVIPTCPKVNNIILADNQPTEALIRWSSDSAATYHVVVTTEEIDIDYLHRVPASKILLNNPSVTADSILISGLTPATHYYVYIRTLCSDESSDWAEPFAFLTPCAILTLTKTVSYTNGFENEPELSREVSCWDIISSPSSSWPAVYNDADYARTGNQFLSFGADQGPDETSFVVMNEFTNPVNTLRLRFWLRGMAFDASENDSIIVGVMTSSSEVNTFIPVASFQASSSYYDAYYEEIEVLFDSYSGPDGRIALKRVPVIGVGMYGDMFSGSAIDDVTIDSIPSCLRVTDVVAGRLTESSAVISWLATSALQYQVLVADTTLDVYNIDPSHVISVDSVTADSIILTSLSPVTDYHVYVRGNCGAGDYADYSREYIFRTAGTLPYYQNFDSVEIFPREMTEYIALNLDSVVAGSETPTLNLYSDFTVDNTIAEDTVTIRYNIYGDENFRLLCTPLFLFDSTITKSLTFNLSKRAFATPDAASDSTNSDDLFYVLAANPDMNSFIMLDSWTNDSLGKGNHSLRNDVDITFSNWEVDLSSLHGSYMIVFAAGSLVENDDYDIHIDNIIIAPALTDSFTVSGISDNDTMGYVTGSGIYCYGSTVTLSAVANRGYHFVEWSDNNTNSTRTVVVTCDTTLIAYFEADTTYLIYVDVVGNGSVTGDGYYYPGEMVTLVATPDNGWKFDGWSGDSICESSLIMTFVATRDMNLTATFSLLSSVDEISAASYIAYTEGSDIVVSGVEHRIVSLYDAAGRLLSTVPDASSSLRFSNLPSGIYYIRIPNLTTTAIVLK